MMDRKRLYWFGGVLVLTVVAWVMWWPDYFGLCAPLGESGHYNCVDFYVSVAQPTSVLFSGVLFSFFIILFTRPAVFKTWKIFMFAYIILSIFLIAITPEVGEPLLIQPGRNVVSLWLSIGFVAISLLLIIYKSWRLKKIKPTYSSSK